MYDYKEIKQVHLEVTTRCNASCSQCPRNISGGLVNPNIQLIDLKLEDCKKIFPELFIKQLDSIFMCGNYGDALMASDTLKILEYFRNCNYKIRLGIHTNASGRNKEWWELLAKVVSYCRFSIDGLEDTNHIYRKNTSWKKIMQSVEWFVAAGGNAEWDFIVFKHNQHQVEEARTLSKNLGFTLFNVKKTSRFYNPYNSLEEFKKDVLNKSKEVEYTIQPPDNPKYINEANISLTGQVKNANEFNQYLESTSIQCTAVKSRQIYVSAEGLVFPCCYLSNIYSSNPGIEMSQVLQIINQLPEGKKSLDAKKYGIEKIVSETFFQNTIPESWNKKSFSEGRLYKCAKTCGNCKLN